MMISFWMIYAIIFFILIFLVFLGLYYKWYQENRFDRLATKIHKQDIELYDPDKDLNPV
jgi:hypothetical protein